MKKIFIAVLCVAISISSFSVSYGKSFPINSQSKKQVIKVTNSNHDEIFNKYNIQIPEIADKDIFSEVTYGDMTIEYIDATSAKASQYNITSTSLSDSQVRIITQPVQSHTNWVQDNTSRHGLAYWADVAFNLTIGSKTKYAWKFATILGINPSKLMTSYYPGDYAGHYYQKIYTYKYAQVCPSNTWTTLVTAESLKLTTFTQMSGMDINGNPLSEYNDVSEDFVSSHYLDSGYLRSKAKELYARNGIIEKAVYNID